MSQKFRLKQARIKSEFSDRSGLVTENMTSVTNDKVVGTTFKNVIVNELGEYVVGTGLPVLGFGSYATFVSTSAADIETRIIDDNFSPITVVGVITYLPGTVDPKIGDLGVLNNVGTISLGKIKVTATGLQQDTLYLARPYAINGNGIVYGDEVSFTTLPIYVYTAGWFEQLNRYRTLNMAAAGTISTSSPVVDVRSLAYHNGYVYVGGGFTPGAIGKYIATGTTFTAAGSFVGSVTLGGGNQTHGIGILGTNMYVAVWGVGVVKIDIGTFTVSATLAVTNPTGVEVDGTNIYVTLDGGSIIKIDEATFSITSTISVGLNPYGIAFTSGSIYVANRGSNTISIIDKSTFTLSGSIAGLNGPHGLYCDGIFLYATNSGTTSNNPASAPGNTVSKIDVTTNTIVSTLTISTGPRGITGDSTHVYAITTGSLRKISKATFTSISSVAVSNGRDVDIQSV